MEDGGWIYQYVFESGAPTMVIDAKNLQVLAANPQVAELTGKSLEQLVGSPPSFLIQSESIKGSDWRRHQSAQMIGKDGRRMGVELTVLCIEKVPKPAVVLRIDTINPDDYTCEDPGDKHESTQRANRELQALYTQRGLLIDRLNNRNQELQQVYRRLSYASKMAAIGELAAGTTHGINNPLAAAVSANREITKLIPQVSKQRIRSILEPLCARTDKALKRIEGIVGDLRRLAQAGAGRAELKQVYLDQEIQLALDLLGHRLKSIELNVEIPEKIRIRVAPDEFIQVIMNLLDNAVHEMNGTGSIRIDAHTEQEEVELRITDRGPGIPKDIIDRIFHPFFSTKTPGQGSGIGLSVARGIIEGYAGSIAVASSDKTGTRFTIRLPTEEQDESKTADTSH
jgi:signal transduction histidine kinase